MKTILTPYRSVEIHAPFGNPQVVFKVIGCGLRVMRIQDGSRISEHIMTYLPNSLVEITSIKAEGKEVGEE